MKAYLLAAGYGTRLKPITDTIPKCMVPINGKPMLKWWLELFEKNNVTEVLINTHYLFEKVEEYINQYNKLNKIKVTLVYEETLLGSGGTVKAQRDFVKDEENFYICYADMITNIDISKMMNLHKKNNQILTMALFRTNNPKSCGIVNIDKNNIITEFVEKPTHPKSNLANAGMYVANKKIFDYFPDKDNFDFGKDILPLLVGKMYGYEMNEYVLDVGTIENYNKAQIEWKEINNKV